MIAEVRDPSIIGRFANLTLGLDLDFTQAAANPANIFLAGERGCFAFMWTAPETFEVHIMLTVHGRGRWGFEAGRRALEYMAAQGMTHLWARVDPNRPEIAVYARRCGLRDTGLRLPSDLGFGPADYHIFNWRA